MGSPVQGRAMKLAAVLLMLALLLLFVAVRADKSGDDRKEGEARVWSEGKSPRSRQRDPELEAARAGTRRAREALREDPHLKVIWEGDSIESSWMTEVVRPFNAAELRRMLNDPDANEWELTELLLRAGAEKHPGFQDSLARPELREKPSIDMALCAYDYSVNGNREALERIVACHRAAGASRERYWNDPAARALAYVDEWDLAKQALGSHPMTSGEADVDGEHYFWLTRRYLFPTSRDFPDYERFKEELGWEQEKSKGR